MIHSLIDLCSLTYTHMLCLRRILQELLSDVIAHLVHLCPSFAFTIRRREAMLRQQSISSHTSAHTHTHSTVFVDGAMFVHGLHCQMKAFFEPDWFRLFLFRFFDPIHTNDEKQNKNKKHNHNHNHYVKYAFHPLQRFNSVCLRQMCLVHERFPLFFERVCHMYRVCTEKCTDYK